MRINKTIVLDYEVMKWLKDKPRGYTSNVVNSYFIEIMKQEKGEHNGKENGT